MIKGTCSFSKRKWCRTSPRPARINKLQPTRPQAIQKAFEPKKTAARMVTTAMRAVQGTSGISKVVNKRARRDSMMRVPRMAGNITAKAQQDRHEALAMQAHHVHPAVGKIGRPGHIAGIFHETQDGEENDQDRQEGQHHADAAQDPAGGEFDQPAAGRAPSLVRSNWASWLISRLSQAWSGLPTR